MKKINWRYAIGEIIIVIVGISIAFWLNNWKEDRRDDATHREYVNSLILDAENEILLLEENNREFQEKLDLITRLTPHLGSGRPDRDSVMYWVFSLPVQTQYVPQDDTYQTLLNSGDMRLFHDLSLRRKIVQYYADAQKVQTPYERIRNIHEKYLGDIFIYELDYIKIAQGDASLLDKPLFRNIVNSLKGSCYMAMEANSKRIAESKELIELLSTD